MNADNVRVSLSLTMWHPSVSWSLNPRLLLDQASVCCSLHCCHWPSNQSGVKLYVPWLTFLTRRTAADKMKSTDVGTLPRIKECIKINYTGLSQKMCHRNSWGGSVQWRMFASLRVYQEMFTRWFFGAKGKKVCTHTHTQTTVLRGSDNILTGTECWASGLALNWVMHWQVC